ncbi:Similar to His1: Histone H1 (Drosophila melanogaster) [Cotesia congregata]|uniref:Similar to His1: Histone H1 (Drosophila melanogaster) n=1 Tax=Cotesia congregata TaxID=51543 RepID=A0A8J2HBG9_COTCN|nr:Similar to His1: Histone H1 (Drosophila melanogaster) [Cotesia congregata]
MTDTEVAPAEEKIVAKTDSPKKAKEVKAKKPAAKATHPSTSDMVTAAIKHLADRHGSSLQAIKKYIASTYKVDVEKQAQFIKKFLKSAVTKGTLVQTKGKGASGSFKLATSKAAAKPKPKAASGEKKVASKKAAVKKPASPKKTPGEPKSPVKKAAGAKKAAVKKPASSKKPAAKAPAKPKASASPKAKKATKAPTAKPKSPKPKKY